jgi:KaiC/GvpD/RAD55 family RecA-like ATPase
MRFEPDPVAMAALLDHLFRDELGGLVELAWTDAQDGKLRHAQLFKVDEIDDLVAKAVEVNSVEGQNAYFGAALRKLATRPFARATDHDFLAAPAFWADLDDDQAVAQAEIRYNSAPPTIGVITGRKPHPRVQLWWRQKSVCDDPDALRKQNAALASALDANPSVINPGRVMRLAGSVAWPTKPGRVIELVELQTFDDGRARVYVDGQLSRAFPCAGAGHVTPQPKATGLDLGIGLGIDPLAMLRAAKPGNWHNSMRSFTAHCVSIGLPDWVIIELSRRVLDDPDDPSDVVTLIEGARRKFATEGTCDPIKVLGGNVFLQEDIPVRETIMGPWLPEQGLVLVYSVRGIGKTFFVLNVAYAVATGGEYLSWQAKQRRTLFIDGEMPAWTMQARLRSIVGANPPKDLDDWFRIVTPDLCGRMPDLATKEGHAKIDPLLASGDLLVLDNLSTLCRSGVENEAESWLPVQAWLLNLRRRGVTVLLVHHAGKSGTQRGTSRKEDALDTVIALRRPMDYEAQDGARFEIHFEKARGFTGEDVASTEARLVTDGLGHATWEATKIGDRIAAEVAERVARGLSEREIANELGVSKTTVNRKKRTLL